MKQKRRVDVHVERVRSVQSVVPVRRRRGTASAPVPQVRRLEAKVRPGSLHGRFWGHENAVLGAQWVPSPALCGGSVVRVQERQVRGVSLQHCRSARNVSGLGGHHDYESRATVYAPSMAACSWAMAAPTVWTFFPWTRLFQLSPGNWKLRPRPRLLRLHRLPRLSHLRLTESNAGAAKCFLCSLF